ncbi:MAG: AAA family ATPase [Thermoplasmata archaeon]|nr:AAA family ATPase [Thermoplasmata archaeon]
MIKRLHIEHFKSIEELDIGCSRINIFIGEPNTGKSNILEALGLHSAVYYGLGETGEEDELERKYRKYKLGYRRGSIPLDFFVEYTSSKKARLSSLLSRFIRMDNIVGIFRDRDTTMDVKVKVEEGKTLTFSRKDGLEIRYGRSTVFSYEEGDYRLMEDRISEFNELSAFKFYRFKRRKEFSPSPPAPLLPPDGKNLLGVIEKNEKIAEMISDILGKYGLGISLEPSEGQIRVTREIKKMVVSGVPYHMLSDTLQRVFFYMAAILSNKDSILILEEPESHSFPYHTKFLAETIAADRNNQYFITTHNPYFLSGVVSKAEKGDVRVYLTTYKDYKTLLHPVKIEDIYEYDTDIFFNLERLVD